MRSTLFLLMVSLAPLACAKTECHEMSEQFYKSKLPIARNFFESAKKFPIDRVDISAGLDCGDHVYFEFEAKPEFNNVGYHWEVRMEKATERMSIIDGI